MSQTQIIGLIIMTLIFAVMMILVYASNNHSLNGIKSKQIGDGQHGTARFSTKAEIKKTYTQIPFDPKNWRQGVNQPHSSKGDVVQGTIVGCKTHHGKTYALVDEGDVHTMMVGAAGCGKTAFFLYPNIEFACASGMSFLSTDCKGDVARNYGEIAKKYYGYNVSVLDLRNPTKSDGNNMLHLVNKYFDIYKKDKDNLSAKAKAEKYAKITAKTIINIGGAESASMGQNAFFYDAAEGLISSIILLIAEFGAENERHIISVFKMIQDLIEPMEEKNTSEQKQKKPRTGFKTLMDKLPDEHKAKWLSGSALHSADQAMLSVMSTSLSRLNSFIDSELEQLLCFGTTIDAEKFCSEKSALFIILPEEEKNKYFMVSLIIQQMYREILAAADENGGKLDNRIMFFLDEFGTFPKIDGAESMFSASRSRKISIIAIIQSFAQLEQNYGREGSDIIVDNTQLTIFGGFAPNSSSADILSKALGEQTVLSGSISHGKDKSRSLQMIGRPLMSSDELKSMPKGQFIVMKTGTHPMISPLKLYFKWGIKFEEPYMLEDKGARRVKYMNRDELMRKAELKYPQKKIEYETEPDEDYEEFQGFPEKKKANIKIR